MRIYVVYLGGEAAGVFGNSANALKFIESYEVPTSTPEKDSWESRLEFRAIDVVTDFIV